MRLKSKHLTALIAVLAIVGPTLTVGKSRMVRRNPKQWELNPDGVEQDDMWSCNICEVSMLGFRKMLSLDTSQKLMQDYVTTQICTTLISNKKMCDGLVKQVGNYILNTLSESLLSPEYFCEELSPACADSEFEFYSAIPDIDRIIFKKIPSI